MKKSSVRKINLEYIQEKLKSGKTIEEIIESFNWKEFESLVAEIFAANGFFVKRNFRFKTTRRHEIDLLAVNNDAVFAVDCKEWGKGRYKKSSLKAAIANQESRVEHLKKFLKRNPIAKRALKYKQQELLSMIVTWLDEDMKTHSNSIVVPVWKLNSFLLNGENFLSTK